MCVAHLPAENEPPRSFRSEQIPGVEALSSSFKKNPLPTATPNPKEESKVCVGLGFFELPLLLLFFAREGAQRIYMYGPT